MTNLQYQRLKANLAREREWHGDSTEMQFFLEYRCHDIYWDQLQGEIDRIAATAIQEKL